MLYEILLEIFSIITNSVFYAFISSVINYLILDEKGICVNLKKNGNMLLQSLRYILFYSMTLSKITACLNKQAVKVYAF